MAEELVVPDAGGEIEEIKGALQQAQALVGIREIEPEDPQATQLAIAARILGAETEADAFRDIPTYSTKTSVDVPFEVRDVRMYRSSYSENGPGAFVACDAVHLETGEQCVLNTGAVNVAAKLLWLKNHDALPRKVKTVKKATTSAGFDVLDLVTL